MNRSFPLNLFSPRMGLFFVWCIAVFTGGWAADYGIHWDEDKLIRGICWSIEHRTLLPQSFLYPSLLHMISLVLVGIQGMVLRAVGSKITIDQSLHAIAQGHAFLISARLMTVLLSSLSIFWVALAIRVWRKNPWEALLGAALLGFSWEVNYHSRWFTVDPIMMQFGSLVILCLVQAKEAPKRARWGIFSAIAAGLAAGSKYTAGLCLLPVMGLLFIQEKGSTAWKKAGILVAFFIVTFLATTPGTILNWGQMHQDLLFQSRTYFTLGNDAYTVPRGFPHLVLMLRYLGEVFFSWYTPAALLLSMLAMVGMIDLIKQESRFGTIFLMFPVAYVAFFSAQIVMIARNLLILLPFAAILAARGATVLGSLLWRPLRPGLITLIVMITLGNSFWLVYASWTIRVRDRFGQAEPLAYFIHQHPQKRFLLTQAAATELESVRSPYFSNVTGDYKEPSDFAIFNTAEARERFHGRWKANRPDTCETWFGPFEVNLNYYHFLTRHIVSP